MPSSRQNAKRLIAYVDGFNLYFGMRDKGWKKYYWLNVCGLATNMLRGNQQLVAVKYFTAQVTTPSDKARRQSTYLEALGTLRDCSIIKGHYMPNKSTCFNCGHEHIDYKEKMTDVNMSVEMISDTIHDEFEVAMLISADSDLVPVLKFIKSNSPEKLITVVFPPARHSVELEKLSDVRLHISDTILARSQFTPAVTRKDGFVLQRPAEWY
jgi:hypothetical protein